MAKRVGNSVLLYIETSTGVYTKLGGQRDVNLGRSADALDASDKDDIHNHYEGGQRSSQVTLDRLFVKSDAAYAKLLDAWNNNIKVGVEERVDNVAVNRASAVLTDVSEANAFNGMTTCSVSFQIDGAWTPVT
jgi:predicted secreted protein